MEDEPQIIAKEFPPEIIEEIKKATQKIEDMVGNTDIEPEHLENALSEARAVFAKYEYTDGNAEFDEALDILMSTIQNTEDLEKDIQGGMSEVEFRDAA
jgi:hypothetical protein